MERRPMAALASAWGVPKLRRRRPAGRPPRYVLPAAANGAEVDGGEVVLGSFDDGTLTYGYVENVLTF